MAKVRLSTTAWRVGLPALVSAAGATAAVVGLARFGKDGNSAYFPWAALLFVSGTLFLVVIVFDVVAGRAAPDARSRYGWVNAVLGADGRVSTSKTQMFLWTVSLAAALLYLTGISIFRAGEHDGSVLAGTDWGDYLILLGGPFAAGVLAKFTLLTKLDGGQVQKTLTGAASGDAVGAPGDPGDPGDPTTVTPGEPQAVDVVTNDAGEIDLVDSQYLVFNLVALLYVFGTFISRIIDQGVPAADKFSLPDVPPVLLGLTSAAAATYVANKAALKNSPGISSVNPLPPVSGAAVDVLGVNLVPLGDDPATTTARTRVVVVGVAGAAGAPPPADSVVSPTAASPTKVTFTMPAIYAGGTVDVQVVTAGNVATPSYRTDVT